jgi:tetratricopeptide (TPR) repeat protein
VHDDIGDNSAGWRASNGSVLRRIKHRRRLVLLRDDHIGDPVGAIFLDPSTDNEDAIIARLSDYLGKRVRVVKAELTGLRAEVEVEVRALADEANRLAAAALDLSRKGGRRNAIALFEQALDLDPLNRDACFGLGLLLAELNRHAEALAMLKLARESGPETVELLHALGRVCIQSDRTASAISYLEKGFELDPGHFGVRRALGELGRKPKPPPRQPNSGPLPMSAKPNLKQR